MLKFGIQKFSASSKILLQRCVPCVIDSSLHLLGGEETLARLPSPCGHVKVHASVPSAHLKIKQEIPMPTTTAMFVGSCVSVVAVCWLPCFRCSRSLAPMFPL